MRDEPVERCERRDEERLCAHATYGHRTRSVSGHFPVIAHLQGNHGFSSLNSLRTAALRVDQSVDVGGRRARLRISQMPIVSTSARMPVSAQMSARLKAMKALSPPASKRVRNLHVVPRRREAVAENAGCENPGGRCDEQRRDLGDQDHATEKRKREEEPGDRALVIRPRLRRDRRFDEEVGRRERNGNTQHDPHPSHTGDGTRAAGGRGGSRRRGDARLGIRSSASSTER